MLCPNISANSYCDTIVSQYDVFIARFILNFSSSFSFVEDPQHISSLVLYPNPASEYLILSFNVKQRAEIVVQLYNAVGQLIKADWLKTKFGQVNYQLNLEGLSMGIYMVQVRIGEEMISKKFIKFQM